MSSQKPRTSLPSIVAGFSIVVWFGLTGVLWYLRPPDLLWLLGSLALFAAFIVGFQRYVRRQ